MWKKKFEETLPPKEFIEKHGKSDHVDWFDLFILFQKDSVGGPNMIFKKCGMSRIIGC